MPLELVARVVEVHLRAFEGVAELDRALARDERRVVAVLGVRQCFDPVEFGLRDPQLTGGAPQVDDSLVPMFLRRSTEESLCT